MSINTTPFLHLPQWTEQEHPSFLSEMNQAYASIDTGYGDIKTIAQTGVTGATEAVAAANEAKQQSQANAGAITTLQQSLTQLEADFVDSHYSRQITLTSEPIENVTVSRQIITYNHYFANIYFEIKFNSNMTAPSTETVLLNNVGGMPGTVQKLAGITNIILESSQYIPICKFDGTTLSIPPIPGSLTIKRGGYAIFFSVPVFISTNSMSRDALLDNCLYIPA